MILIYNRGNKKDIYPYTIDIERCNKKYMIYM